MFNSENGKIILCFDQKVTSNIFNTRTIIKNEHKGGEKAIMKCRWYEDSHDQILDNFI